VGSKKAKIARNNAIKSSLHPRIICTRRMRKKGKVRALRINLVPCQTLKIRATMVMKSAVRIAVCISRDMYLS